MKNNWEEESNTIKVESIVKKQRNNLEVTTTQT